MSGNYTNTNTCTDMLIQESAYDTDIYDSSVHDNQIVALYKNAERARSARDELLAIGVPEQTIRITDRDQDRFTGGVDYERNDSGLWGAIRSLFMPDEEAHGYAEGIRRGHAILVVQPGAAMDRHRVIQVLENTDPIDFDAKLEEWRQAGYEYPSVAETGAVTAGATGATVGTPTPGVAADVNAMRATDTTAAGTFRNAPPSESGESDYMSGERSNDLPGGAVESRSESAGGASKSGTAARVNAAGPGMSASSPKNVQLATAPAHAVGVQNAKATTFAMPTGQDETIKVVEERLRVGKREVVKGAVRVRSYVVERPVEQNVQLHDERVNIERRPVDRPAATGDNALFHERLIEARSVGEEVVVGKEAHVVEEVALHKENADQTETVRNTVRKTQVEIEGDPNIEGSVSGRDRTTDAALGTMNTSDDTTTSTAGATSSGTNAPRK